MSKFERARSARAAVAAMVTEEAPPTDATPSDAGVRPTAVPDERPAQVRQPPAIGIDTERITIYLPTDLVDRIERRIAEIRRRHKVSVSGYIEAALYEFMSADDSDIAHLKKHRVKARRSRI